MRKLKNLIKFIVLSVLVLLFMAVVDILVLAYVDVKTGESMSSGTSAGYVASQLERTTDEYGAQVYVLSAEGVRYIDGYNVFAFVLDESGDVVWSYRMPDELPRHYKLSDVVRFTRYYLDDYPVYTHIVDDGVVVMGTERYKTWKYQLVFQNATLEAYMDIFPVMLIVNIAALVLVPFFLIRRDARKREMGRTAYRMDCGSVARYPHAACAFAWIC